MPGSELRDARTAWAMSAIRWSPVHPSGPAPVRSAGHWHLRFAQVNTLSEPSAFKGIDGGFRAWSMEGAVRGAEFRRGEEIWATGSRSHGAQKGQTLCVR